MYVFSSFLFLCDVVQLLLIGFFWIGYFFYIIILLCFRSIVVGYLCYFFFSLNLGFHGLLWIPMYFSFTPRVWFCCVASAILFCVCFVLLCVFSFCFCQAFWFSRTHGAKVNGDFPIYSAWLIELLSFSLSALESYIWSYCGHSLYMKYCWGAYEDTISFSINFNNSFSCWIKITDAILNFQLLIQNGYNSQIDEINTICIMKFILPFFFLFSFFFIATN